MRYQPSTGSNPYKAIQHLRTLPLGTQLRSAELAKVAGCKTTDISGQMERAVIAGALVCKKTTLGTLLWSLSSDWWHWKEAAAPTFEPCAGGVRVRQGRAEIVLAGSDIERLVAECAV